MLVRGRPNTNSGSRRRQGGLEGGEQALAQSGNISAEDGDGRTSSTRWEKAGAA
jgi:hypothetical protein